MEGKQRVDTGEERAKEVRTKKKVFFFFFLIRSHLRSLYR